MRVGGLPAALILLHLSTSSAKYSPDGRLRQLESAVAATRRGSAVVAVCDGCDYGVVVCWPGSGSDDAKLAGRSAQDEQNDEGYVAARGMKTEVAWPLSDHHLLAATGLVRYKTRRT